MVEQIYETNRLHEGVKNAINDIGDQLNYFTESLPGLAEFIEHSNDIVDKFIRERIVSAQDLMVQNGLSLLSKNKKEVIMCFG